VSDLIEAFVCAAPDADLADLKNRLARTRWPEAETVDDWSQGVPLQAAQALCAYWRDSYDWRRCEAALNAFDQFTTDIDGLSIHFLHVRSPDPGALPILLTHGWPGSVLEFLKVIGPLSDPAAHGAPGAQAFHVIAPSLPGYGFSGKPGRTGWGAERTAQAWITLMRRLGYGRFVAQGGDWGAAVTTAVAAAAAPECIGIHLNMPIAHPTKDDIAEMTVAEQAALADIQRFQQQGSAYNRLQSTKPQTIGYALADSPMSQATWIYEKLQAWSDNDGTPENAFTRDEILDLITLYWLTNSGASSARMYWESPAAFQQRVLDLPVGVSIFPREIIRPSRRWAERAYPQLIHWNELPKGGHFAAYEQPAAFVDELRACFAKLPV
jgi:pimeloyl-ACP methyl ester carboxylesterase